MKYLYGPVPSRRLGRSLGIDPIPSKTCNYQCIYCQLGKTTHFTNDRKDFYPKEEIFEDQFRFTAYDHCRIEDLIGNCKDKLKDWIDYPHHINEKDYFILLEEYECLKEEIQPIYDINPTPAIPVLSELRKKEITDSNEERSGWDTQWLLDHNQTLHEANVYQLANAGDGKNYPDLPF